MPITNTSYNITTYINDSNIQIQSSTLTASTIFEGTLLIDSDPTSSVPVLNNLTYIFNDIQNFTEGIVFDNVNINRSGVEFLINITYSATGQYNLTHVLSPVDASMHNSSWVQLNDSSKVLIVNTQNVLQGEYEFVIETNGTDGSSYYDNNTVKICVVQCKVDRCVDCTSGVDT